MKTVKDSAQWNKIQEKENIIKIVKSRNVIYGYFLCDNSNIIINGEIIECSHMNLGMVAHYPEKKLDTCLIPYKDELQID